MKHITNNNDKNKFDIWNNIRNNTDTNIYATICNFLANMSVDIISGVTLVIISILPLEVKSYETY